MVGGLIYGEVYEAIRGGTMPLIDRPYIILQLMILEAPEPVPPEGALVAFWYIMPVGFVLMVGLGAADRNLSTTMGHSTGLIREQCPVW